MEITWFGTASVAIKTGDQHIIWDPFVTLPGAAIRNSEEDFQRYKNVLLTHGHMDHLASIPKLVKKEDVKVWCTMTPAKTLRKKGVDRHKIHLLAPGETIHFPGMEIDVLKGRHIHYDRGILKKTFLNTRMISYCYNLPWNAVSMIKFPENGETVAYLIKAEGKRILLLGSLGLDPEETYPSDVDLLILPFQGASDLITPTMEILEKIRPKRLMIDHYDDAFPPISNNIPLWELKKWMRVDHPEIKVVKPKYKKTVHL